VDVFYLSSRGLTSDMTAEEATMTFGCRVYGVGVMALGITCMAFGAFDPGQSVPEHFPARIALAYASGVFMVSAAGAIQWRRIAAWGAGALTAYYALFVVMLMNGRLLLTDYAIYVTYENIAMQLAIAASGLIVYATTASINAALAARLIRLGQLVFGVCALVFGGAHFAYTENTASIVPRWLPPTQVFWAYVTGVCFVATSVAILTGVRARLAGILVTAMLVSFGLLANLPILLADHSSHWNWTECAVNLAIDGAAWVVAGSLARPKRSTILE
jgi:uncharacterized membrane protein